MSEFVKLLIAAFLFASLTHESSAQDDFDRKVAPLLAARCLDCHSGGQPKGGLDLSSKAGAAKGGENGSVIQAGKVDGSELWARVSADEMPPKHPLTASEKKILQDWIQAGAKWGTDPIDRFRFTTAKRAGYDWWSLQPIRNVSPPEIVDTTWPRNAIDEFVWNQLNEAQLSPAKEADARTLIRRVYFDLIGLPPSPAAVQAFVANPTNEAYAKIVNQLLLSDRYGERWGRHWLDVVRFGESDGFERNGPRMNAWPYRDWVINALNNDMPYDEFVRMQLIGDLQKPGREGTAAVGFLVAGVHNTVVGGSERMKKLAKQDEFEEVIGAIGQTFLGLTVNCSRCHDHKFDPIRQSEYYQMVATIAGMNHGERTARSEGNEDQIAALRSVVNGLNQKIGAIDSKGRSAVLALRKSGKVTRPDPPKAFARWEFDGDLKDSIGSLHGKAVGSAKLENGALVVDGKSYVETPVLQKDIREKTLEAWVQVSTLDQKGGAAISLESVGGGVFDAIVYAERQPQKWMAGSNGFVRTAPFDGPAEGESDKRPVHMAYVYKTDGTIIGYRDGKPYGKPIRKNGLHSYESGKSHFLFGLRHSPGGGNRFLRAKIHKAAFYDRALNPGEVAASAGSDSDYVSEKQLIAVLSADDQRARSQLTGKLTEVEQQLRTLEAATNQKIYTMTPGNPYEIRFLERGDIEKPGDVAIPAGIASLRGVDAKFGLTAKSSDADRRRKLADWVTGANNPLLARVIVNRVWQYHFGSGLVITSSDFGFNGGQPSHPDLLDWLAVGLKTNGFRLKWLHRQIVLSSTYRQASSVQNPAARKMDASNRLLWRMNPRRLEAESIRDSMLFVSGKLNLAMGGPGFVDVSISPNNGTTYYIPKQTNSDDVYRRTVYRFTPRGGRSALLDTFDCPDPATAAPRRAVTTTPLQALSLLNSAFVLQMAEFFGERMARESGEEIETSSVVDRVWQTAIGRLPDEQERQLSMTLVKQHGLAALCRGLFNISEFVIVE